MLLVPKPETKVALDAFVDRMREATEEIKEACVGVMRHMLQITASDANLRNALIDARRQHSRRKSCGH